MNKDGYLKRSKRRHRAGSIIWILFLCTIAILAIVFFKSKVYRTVRVENTDGKVSLKRNAVPVPIFNGLQLIPDDLLSTGDESQVLFLVDADKHIMAGSNTRLKINAVGSNESGSVTIKLISGQSLFTLDNKLNEYSTFEVSTPNATMSVRGTTFGVIYDEENDTTAVNVEKGVVAVDYGESGQAELTAGERIYVKDDETVDFSEAYPDSTEDEIWEWADVEPVYDRYDDTPASDEEIAIGTEEDSETETLTEEGGSGDDSETDEEAAETEDGQPEDETDEESLGEEAGINVSGAIEDKLDEKKSEAENAVSEKLDDVSEGVNEKLDDVKDNVKDNVKAGIGDFFRNLGNRILQKLEEFLMGLM